MLEQIECPEGVLGFKAAGKIEKSDYETVLEPAVKALRATHDELRFVYMFGDDFEGYSAAAALQDAKLGFGHFSTWKRIAIVTDHEWLTRSIAMLGWMMPGDVKTFSLAELDDAIDWAADDAT